MTTEQIAELRGRLQMALIAIVRATSLTKENKLPDATVDYLVRSEINLRHAMTALRAYQETRK